MLMLAGLMGLMLVGAGAFVGVLEPDEDAVAPDQDELDTEANASR